MSQSKVYSVEAIDLDLLKSNPPRLNILAHGYAASSGWTRPELSPYIYIVPPPDGIYGFDFVAEPPKEISLQVLTPIQASFVMLNIPKEFRGVRIHAVSGTKEALLGQTFTAQRKVAIKGVLTDEGVECQTMRTESGELYTLVGNLSGFTVGDKVYVSGTITPVSFCMQGVTIAVDWISKDMPKAALVAPSRNKVVTSKRKAAKLPKAAILGAEARGGIPSLPRLREILGEYYQPVVDYEPIGNRVPFPTLTRRINDEWSLMGDRRFQPGDINKDTVVIDLSRDIDDRAT